MEDANRPDGGFDRLLDRVADLFLGQRELFVGHFQGLQTDAVDLLGEG